MKITCSLILSLLALYSLHGQQVDVEGDTRIEGTLNIIAAVGDSSIFIGANAGRNDEGINHNTFIGNNAGMSNTSGSANTFVGLAAGKSNTTGYFNTFLGAYAGAANTTGASNLFLGEFAGFKNTTGFYNTFLGQESGQNSTVGSRNTLIGKRTILGFNNMVGSIAIGFESQVDCDSCAVIGSSSLPVNLGLGTSNPSSHKLHVTSDDFTGAFIKGNDVAIELGGANSSFGSGSDDAVIRTQVDQLDGDLFLVSNDFITLHLNEDNNPDDSKFEIRNGANNTVATIDEAGNMVIAGNLTENSDRNLKYQISTLSGVLPRLLELAGYSYLLRDRPEQGAQIGLIAQEVEAQFPDLVYTNEEGIKSVNYTRFVPLLIEGLKAQATALDIMNNRISELEKALRKLN